MENNSSNPLYEAIQRRDVQQVRNLLLSGADVNDHDDDIYMGSTLFNIATSTKNEEIVKLLILSGADVNLKNQLQQTPLQYAVAYKCEPDMIKMLIDTGADFNDCKDSNNESLLHLASRTNNLKLIRCLISNEANVNEKNSDGQTALHVAAIENKKDSHFSAIEVLLRVGANVNAQDKIKNRTALHYSVNYANFKSVQLLLSFKANVNLTDLQEETPVFEAVASQNVEVLQLLIDHGSIIDHENRFNHTPLHKTCQQPSGNKKIIKILLKNGADVRKIDYKNFYSIAKKTLFIIFRYLNMDTMNLVKDKILNHGSWEAKACFMSYLALLHALEFQINPEILELIGEKNTCKSYFGSCVQELLLAKSTKIKDSWVTFFDLMTVNIKKLKNYAGNEELMKNFVNSDYKTKFPVYKMRMLEKVTYGRIIRKLFDESSIVLSNCLPIFNPNHLIIRDIFDCISCRESLSKLCNVDNDE